VNHSAPRYDALQIGHSGAEHAKSIDTTVGISEVQDLRGFVAELKHRPSIRLVKVATKGSVEPSRRDDVIVMQPRVTIIATAYDPDAREIIRWKQKWDVGSGLVTIGHRDKHRREAPSTQDIVDQLEVEQYQVADGEWTTQLVQDILDRRRRED
jgi:hypothetical protein